MNQRVDAGVEKYSPEIEKEEGEFWVTYAGTIGTSYDIRTLVLTGEELIRRRRLNIKIKILGGGPLKEELEQLAKEHHCKNVEFVAICHTKRWRHILQSQTLLSIRL